MNSFTARLRDSLRVFRGKRPRHSALARQLASEYHVACDALARPTCGIHSEADVTFGTLAPAEYEFLKRLVEGAAETPGPIVQFGTLLGETTADIRRWKSPDQELIIIDPADANPWNLSPAAYSALVAQLVKHTCAEEKLTRLSISSRDFFATQCSTAPALVFINYARSNADARNIIAWAKAVHSHTIAGRGYDFSCPDIKRAVDEYGGPDRVSGTAWRLNLQLADCCSCSTPESRSAPVTEGAPHDDRLVSIVIPAYNAAEFIDAALADVSRQLYRKWEVVVVEDGSAVTVERNIDRFKSLHPDHRVEYYRKPKNEGVSRARNDAIALCRGEFVAFLDADDRWSPDHLQRKVRLLERTGCDLAYSRVEMFDSDSDAALCTWGPTDEELRLFPESMFVRPFLQPSGVVVLATLMTEVGGFDESLAFGEDYDYWFRAIHAGKKFCFDEKVTSRYRKNHASAATTDRLVLCHDGIARVTYRHLSLAGGDLASRQGIVAKHFLTAGTGHLAYTPSPRNGCDPEAGKTLLLQASQLEVDQRDGQKYYRLARFASATRTSQLFRRYFRRKYRRNAGY